MFNDLFQRNRFPFLILFSLGLLTSCSNTAQENPEPYSTLIWEDNFEQDGSISMENWSYETGRGNNGWGNGESQYYTARPENIVVEEGLLKIHARREDYQGARYTSARIKSQGLFQFTYGKVEVRAKLPSGRGVWPAIWMLGRNFTSVGWPRCGEIDIMEYAGNRPGQISAAIHNASSYGNTQNTQTKSVENETSEFHVYSIEWDAEMIRFFVDGERFYVYSPYPKTPENWPFDADQFLILNVAIGGSYGGSIDPNFRHGTLEVDYVRVYQ